MSLSQSTVINDTAAGALSTIMLLAVMFKVFVVMLFILSNFTSYLVMKPSLDYVYM